MLNIALVVNEPPPYRIPVFNRLAARPDVRLRVIFCCRREPNREWDLPPIAFEHIFLRERIRTVNGRYIHHNPDVLIALARCKPDIVVGNGFNPTHLYAMLWTQLMRRRYVPMTDGTQQSERSLSALHVFLRKQLYARAPAFIAASQGGLALYRQYGIAPERCFLSFLCADNERFRPDPEGDDPSARPWDFMFCGRMEPGKSPDFVLEVAGYCAQRLGRQVRVLFVGSGSLEAVLRERAQRMCAQVHAHFHGFASQAALPALYQSAKIFLFPTRADVWGVVANEACAAGLPVIVTPYAGVANELIIDGQNGYIRTLEVDAWGEAALQLLASPRRLAAFGERSVLKVAPYHFEAAAQGIVDACVTAQQAPRDYAAVSRPV